MELTNAIHGRRSIRKYESNAISKEAVHKVIQAGIAAPSAKNRQPWRFVVVQGAAKTEMLAVMERGMEREQRAPLLPGSSHYLSGAKYTAAIMKQAPVTIFIINPLNEMTYPDNFEDKIYEMANVQSVGACIQNMLLTAVDLGLGGVRQGKSNPIRLKLALIALCCVIVSHNSYGYKVNSAEGGREGALGHSSFLFLVQNKNRSV
ncbi:nitroreductase family protein [Clostridia bacterium OttesenSCG-928-F22]|nr:nitroreductase family protein [Clostridia bacterium OttesenSCG-928-F22]